MVEQDEQLKGLSLHERLAYFYCAYVHEEEVETEVDGDAVRRWEKIMASRRKSRERVCILLNQMENTSAVNVRALDKSYRAKRELQLISEGTLRTAASSAISPSSGRGGALSQVEIARANNELLQECGALTVFTDRLQRSIHAFRGLNFQHLDLDQVDALINDLQQDMVLVYLLILFNAHKKNAVFDRQLMVIGIMGPSYSLVSILDCLSQLNVLPGFPIKRLLLLFHEWFSAVMGDFGDLTALKRLRRERSDIDPSILKDDAEGVLHCKTFKPYYDTVQLDSQDPYYLQKKKFAKKREAIHNKYLHKANYELKSQLSSEADLATRPLDALDDEWEERVETLYKLFLPCMRDYTTFLGNLVTLSCGSALNARDKKTFYSRRPSSGEQYGMTDFSAPNGGDNGNDNQFWKWILREKAIVLDVSNLIILLLYKHFRASHACKAEYFMQFFLEANVLATLTKFMNKDIATYLQVSRQDVDETKTGFFALEKELDKRSIRFEEDMNEYSIQSTRTITSILRILQKLTKRKPNIIKNALCRGSTIVWLKRVVALQIPLPRLYALKLVKSQAKYLGHQWVKKYTCFSLLTEVYLYVRPELDDGWLHYEDEDLNKPPSQDSVERIIFGEMQAYHHKHYFDSPFGGGKSLPAGVSAICEDRKELSSDLFIADGGRLTKMYDGLKLDPINFCKQYEKWLDAENLTHDTDADAAPLPISFQ
ncbi:Striatin-interacting protein 2 [Phytophthora boehmeriae]|uniref:Striatin-interacting protein 2 n=1 Tax=Phytophthora boehmeriae TaxID=109152 RepID=A0A8T1X079_9STRA|nr:Striatin-interacting protein 2 [Phytophthora boehmeriae]